MESIRQAGIWMDYSVAYIMEYRDGAVERQRVESSLFPRDKQSSAAGSRNLLHFREKRKLIAYYKKIVNLAASYDSILLFGPTKAKNQLLHLINNDRQFDELTIDIRQADKMTEYQLRDFVSSYFQQRLHKSMV